MERGVARKKAGGGAGHGIRDKWVEIGGAGSLFACTSDDLQSELLHEVRDKWVDSCRD